LCRRVIHKKMVVAIIESKKYHSWKYSEKDEKKFYYGKTINGFKNEKFFSSQTVFPAVSFIFKVYKGWDVKTQHPESIHSIECNDYITYVAVMWLLWLLFSSFLLRGRLDVMWL